MLFVFSKPEKIRYIPQTQRNITVQNKKNSNKYIQVNIYRVSIGILFQFTLFLRFIVAHIRLIIILIIVISLCFFLENPTEMCHLSLCQLLYVSI